MNVAPGINQEKMKPDNLILYERKNGIGYVTLNQPTKRNAISFEMWQMIGNVINDCATNDSIRALLIRGAGQVAFSAGADISQFDENRSSKEQVVNYNSTMATTIDILEKVAKPTIAMIHGFCIGGGLNLAVHCDLRIASNNARFAIPAARLGLAYGLRESQSLVQLIGPAYAKEMLYTGRQFSATEAIDMGLINRIVAINELENYTEKYTSLIAINAPLTIIAAKHIVRESAKDGKSQDNSMINKLVDTCFSSNDYQEGRTAFLEKRQPRFKGK